MKLDLNTLKQKTFELILLDESVINLRKPSKELIIEMDNYRFGTAQKETGETFDLIEELCIKILNNNEEGKKITAKYLKDTKVDYMFQLAIFNGYLEFVQEVMSNPN